MTKLTHVLPNLTVIRLAHSGAKGLAAGLAIVPASKALRIAIVGLIALMLGACASSPSSTQYKSKSELVENADKALIHAELARGYLQQKQYAVAKDELELALRINPQHSQSHYYMALLMLELEQFEKAERHFSDAVAYNSENAAAAHDFGMFLCQINRERESVDYFDIAASNPLFERAELSSMRAGECLARINDPRAEAYLRQALEANPQMRPALFRLAALKQRAGQHFSARAYIERFMAITKPQPASLYLAYQIESSLNATDVAEKYRRQLLEEFPGSEQASQLRRDSRQ